MISSREAAQQQTTCQFCKKLVSTQNLQLHEVRCEKIRKSNPQQMKSIGPQSFIKVPVSDIDPGFTQSLLADIKCSICNERFMTIEMQEQHFQECNALNQNLPCEICKQEIPFFLYEDHIQMCQSENKSQQYGQQGQNQQQQYQQQPIQQYHQPQQHIYQFQQPQQQQYQQQQYHQQQFQQQPQQYQQIESNLYVDNSNINNNQQNNLFKSFNYQNQQQNNNYYQNNQHFDQEDFEDDDDDSDDSHMNDNESDEEGGVDADKLQSNANYSEEQLNNILDNGGVLPQFEDHDLSSTGGLTKEQLSSFPETRHEKRAHGQRHGPVDEDRITCSICMSKYKVKQIVLTIGCMHRFHKKCIVSWLKKNTHCPICKEDQKKLLGR